MVSDNNCYCTVDGVIYSKDKTRTISFPSSKNNLSCTILDSATVIGDATFAYNIHIQSVTIPDSVTLIEEMAFYRCESLETVVMSKNLTAIGLESFEYCNSLTTISLPKSITTIDRYAFSNCDKLETIVFDGTMDEWNAKCFDLCFFSNKPIISCADGDIE